MEVANFGAAIDTLIDQDDSTSEYIMSVTLCDRLTVLLEMPGSSDTRAMHHKKHEDRTQVIICCTATTKHQANSLRETQKISHKRQDDGSVHMYVTSLTKCFVTPAHGKQQFYSTYQLKHPMCICNIKNSII